MRLAVPCIAILAGGVLAMESQGAVLQREANTSLGFPKSSESRGYTSTNAFNLSFTDPVDIVSPPGENNRLFIVEQRGVVSVITNLAEPNRTVFLDMTSRITKGTSSGDERGLLGMAFHPNYAQNRTFFVYYSLTTNSASGNGLHQRLSKFQTSASNPNQALLESEQPLLSQWDEASNHNGGDLAFGPDGYLYVTVGDEGNQNDSLNNSQTIDKDFYSGILRIDVDQKPGNKAPNPHPFIDGPYSIPADNPFVNVTSFNGVTLNPAKIRTEFYAVGLRNPWRISFDTMTGRLYCGDVGGSQQEEIDLIEKGANFGWAFREGTVNGPKSSQAPGNFQSAAPLWSYGRGSGTNQGSSVTGGVVSRASGLPELFGHYLFADYVSGNVWALEGSTPGSVIVRHLFVDTQISGFGIDPSTGDVLYADQNEDTIKRIILKSESTPSTYPVTLSAAGVFQNMTELTPHRGIVGYGVRTPAYADGLVKRHWFSIPELSKQMTFRSEGPWTFPAGTVWIQHFDLIPNDSAPTTFKKVETRVLVRTAQGAYGLSYRWDSQTNATLVAENGATDTFVVVRGGSLKTQPWRYPGRQECIRCHSSAAGYGVGMNTHQLNHPFNFPGGNDNQIKALSEATYFSTPVSGIHSHRTSIPLNDTQDRESRIRSYLAANCAHCHQPGGSGLVLFDARLYTPLSKAGLVNGELVFSGNANQRVLAPGSAANSMLLQRMLSTGDDRMPPNDRTTVDSAATSLLQDWIEQDLPGYQTFPNWRKQHFGNENDARGEPAADPDQDGAPNSQEYLTQTNPNSRNNVWGVVSRKNATAGIDLLFDQAAHRGYVVEFKNSFNDTAWQPLDIPANAPSFCPTPISRILTDPQPGPARFYRIKVFEQ